MIVSDTGVGDAVEAFFGIGDERASAKNGGLSDPWMASTLNSSARESYDKKVFVCIKQYVHTKWASHPWKRCRKAAMSTVDNGAYTAMQHYEKRFESSITVNIDFLMLGQKYCLRLFCVSLVMVLPTA